ncbi:MAG: hypothetical protein C4K58_06420 [Flavobacteriaceae bacterium]|nr:MAG: hypothetical protein C4K58_06420 [Flavobacteriaceae bacterium]
MLFRNGNFDRFLFQKSLNTLTSSNGGTPVKTIPNDSIKRDIRMSSSKSMILMEDTFPNVDSIEIFNRQRMYSSKSGMVMDPIEMEKRRARYDSLQEIQKTQIPIQPESKFKQFMKRMFTF